MAGVEEAASSIDIVVDCSKNKNEKMTFDKIIVSALSSRVAKNVRLSIKHRNSQEDFGIQAIDIFCSGFSGKYKRDDLSWYGEFSGRIAVEIEYKF